MPPTEPDTPCPAGHPGPIVLGIDPGTRVIGYGAVVDAAGGPRLLAAGELRAPGRAGVPARLAALRGELDRLLARIAPDVVVVEQGFTGLNPRSALRIGEGRGVALACAAAAGAEVVELAPAVAKRVLVGNGAAAKEQVARMAAILLRRDELPGSLDATDALSLALAWLRRRGAPRASDPLDTPARRRLEAAIEKHQRARKSGPTR